MNYPEFETSFEARFQTHRRISTRHYATQLVLTGDVKESKSVRQLLTDFYQEVA